MDVEDKNTPCAPGRTLIYINSWMLIGQREIIQVNTILVLYPPETDGVRLQQKVKGREKLAVLFSWHLYVCTIHLIHTQLNPFS